MKSERDREVAADQKSSDSPRLVCRHPSSRFLLVILFLLSLNAVAWYDAILSIILKPFRRKKKPASNPPIRIDFRTRPEYEAIRQCKEG